MTTQRKTEAALALIAIAGVSIALRKATVADGAVLGLSPFMAIGLVACAAWAVPKWVDAR